MARLWILVAALLALTGCQKAEQAPVPRRTAYPRVEVLPATYALPDSLPLPFKVNSAATATVATQSGGQAWLTIAYPTYGATAYFTFTPVTEATVGEVAGNRLDRMALNLGAASAESYSFATASGMNATVLMSPTAPGAAVQALAVGDGWVVSGSTVFPAAAADSIAPLVEAVTADIIAALKEI